MWCVLLYKATSTSMPLATWRNHRELEKWAAVAHRVAAGFKSAAMLGPQVEWKQSTVREVNMRSETEGLLKTYLLPILLDWHAICRWEKGKGRNKEREERRKIQFYSLYLIPLPTYNPWSFGVKFHMEAIFSHIHLSSLQLNFCCFFSIFEINWEKLGVAGWIQHAAKGQNQTKGAAKVSPCPWSAPFLTVSKSLHSWFPPKEPQTHT